jgi:hypothetical protein
MPSTGTMTLMPFKAASVAVSRTAHSAVVPVTMTVFIALPSGSGCDAWRTFGPVRHSRFVHRVYDVVCRTMIQIGCAAALRR